MHRTLLGDSATFYSKTKSISKYRYIKAYFGGMRWHKSEENGEEPRGKILNLPGQESRGLAYPAWRIPLVALLRAALAPASLGF